MDLDELLEEGNLGAIVYRAIYDAVKDALSESELEDALIEGIRIAVDEILEQQETRWSRVARGREN